MCINFDELSGFLIKNHLLISLSEINLLRTFDHETNKLSGFGRTCSNED